MDTFREWVRGWLGKVLLAVLSIPFVLVGVEQYFSGGKTPAVASVNGVDILQSDYDRIRQQQRDNLKERMGPQADLSQLDKPEAREAALTSLIDLEAVSQYADKHGLKVMPEQIWAELKSIPALQENGQFDMKRFESQLSNMGWTPSEFISKQQRERPARQWSIGVLGTGFMSAQEIERLTRLSAQSRSIRFLRMPASANLAQVTASDAEIQQYYSTHAAAYTDPEQFQAEYLQLTPAAVAAEVKLTEADLRAEYDQQVRALQDKEERQASHILIAVGDPMAPSATVDKKAEAAARKKIDELAAQIRKGADFAMLAKANSQDPGSAVNGGDLGFAGKGMYDPAFEKALFDLKKEGNVSTVVRSQYGWHLIKLAAIRRPAATPFEQMRATLEPVVREQKAADLLNERIEKLNEKAFEAADLKEPADMFKLPIQMTAVFTRNTVPAELKDPKLLTALYSDEVLKEGRNSTVIELDGRAVLLRLKLHKPATLRALASVKEQARSAVLLEKAVAMTQQQARAYVARIAKGEKPEAVTAQTWTPAQINRQEAGAPRELVEKAFQLPRPAAGKPSVAELKVGQDVVVLVLDSVTDGSVPPEAMQKQMLASYSIYQGQMDYQDYLQYVRDNNKIERKKAEAKSVE